MSRHESPEPGPAVDIAAVERNATAHRMRVVARIDLGHGAGILLSERTGTSNVLGLGAVDTFGGDVALGLTTDEATALRDALTAWLER